MTVNLSAIGNLAAIVPRVAVVAPESVGLVGSEHSLTWAEIDDLTARLASFLVANGLEVGDRVAIAQLKSERSFLAAHAILRAGGVVVPIDPLAPTEAACRVLVDADIRGVIGDDRTVRALADGIPATAVVVASTSGAGRVGWEKACGHSRGALPAVLPDDRAYIIFTSGSTGRPKGIVHTHRSAMAYAGLAVATYRLTPADRVAGMNPLHFDMSTLELYAAPLAGAAVVVMSEAHLRFPASFVARSSEERVTLWYSVPFLFNQLADRGAMDAHDLSSLRAVLYGGEPWSIGALDQFLSLLPPVELVNVYGPAEVNACTHHHVDPNVGIDGLDDVPIGRAWSGALCLVVGADGKPAEQGEPGELLVAATTAMEGYWRQPDLTAARFHSCGADRWYRTGDVVVERDDGELVYQGRVDHQVKVRGVRLELEAVESVLNDAPGVAHAVAGLIGVPGEASHLGAVVVAASGQAIDADEVARWCVARLPSVAVPARIDTAEGFPATASGKIDRRAVRERIRDFGEAS